MTYDYAQLMMDADFAKMILFALNGITVNDETLAIDDLHKVGPFGSFLSHKSTLKNCRNQSQPDLIDRTMWGRWEKDCGKNLSERAHDKAIHLLETYQPVPLPEEAQRAVREIVERADREMGIPNPEQFQKAG